MNLIVNSPVLRTQGLNKPWAISNKGENLLDSHRLLVRILWKLDL